MKTSFLFKGFVYLYFIVRYSYLGVKAFFFYRGFYYRHLARPAPVLLVMPEEITQSSQTLRTNYLIEDPNHPVDKLVFSLSSEIGPRFCRLPRPKRALIFAIFFKHLLWDLIGRIRNRELNPAYIDAFIIFFRWMLAQGWYVHFDLYQLLREVTGASSPRYRALLSLHEMHFYSRIIWWVARENGIRGIAAQHAIIGPEKLRLFPHQLELRAGCPTPRVFFVYSDEIKELLQPFYPRTDFPLCCSPRYSHWKSDVESGSKPPARRSFVTVATGLMPMNVRVLISALKILIRQRNGTGVDLLLRLHPQGTIGIIDRGWIWMASRQGKIVVSKASLKEDIARSSLMIGSGSTILQEALLCGVPTLCVWDQDALCPAMPEDGEGGSVPFQALTWERLEGQINKKVEDVLVRRVKANMGLFSPDLSTRLIYEAALNN